MQGRLELIYDKPCVATTSAYDAVFPLNLKRQPKPPTPKPCLATTSAHDAVFPPTPNLKSEAKP